MKETNREFSDRLLSKIRSWALGADFGEAVAFSADGKSFVLLRDDGGLQEVKIDGTEFEIEGRSIHGENVSNRGNKK